MSGPYVNDDGDIWIERKSAPWPVIQHEARLMADEMDWGSYFLSDTTLVYEGIVEDVRVSDEHEAACERYPDDPEWAPCTCCRTIVAHHFRVVER
jgi:hypothetical protein